MARPKKTVSYTADAATVLKYFDESMRAKEIQKEASGEISSLNTMMQGDGVHAGVLSHYVALARMKPEEAALRLALEDFYRQALASRLPNPASAELSQPVPFGRRTAAA
jgi:hypothetical protein